MSQVVEVYHIGGKDQVLSQKQTIRLVYHDFAKLPADRCVYSKVWCHGYEWESFLHPKFRYGYLPPFGLKCVSATPAQTVKAKIEFRVHSADFVSCPLVPNVFDGTWERWDDLVIGDVNWERFLGDGNLTLDVTFQVYQDQAPTVRRRKATPIVNIKNLLKSAASFDGTTFWVEGESFPAHLQILQTRAPGLAALVEEFPPKTSTPLQGDTVATFRALLNYIYLDELPEGDEFKRTAIQLLNAADRFDCRDLKFEAEDEIIANGLNVETAADLILLGAAKNCARLKEASIVFFVANSDAVMKSAGWSNVNKSAEVLEEIIRFVLTKNRVRSVDPNNESYYDLMRVSTLHEELEKRGLDRWF